MRDFLKSSVSGLLRYLGASGEASAPKIRPENPTMRPAESEMGNMMLRSMHPLSSRGGMFLSFRRSNHALSDTSSRVRSSVRRKKSSPLQEAQTAVRGRLCFQHARRLRAHLLSLQEFS